VSGRPLERGGQLRVEPEPTRQAGRQRAEDDLVELAALQRLRDGFEGVGLDQLPVGLSPDRPQAGQLLVEPAADLGHRVRVEAAVLPDGCDRHHRVEAGRSCGQTVADLLDVVRAYCDGLDVLAYTFRKRTTRRPDGGVFNGFLPAVSNDTMKKMSRAVHGWRVHRWTKLSLNELAAWVNEVVPGGSIAMVGSTRPR
jgi:hypothetical protein